MLRIILLSAVFLVLSVYAEERGKDYWVDRYLSVSYPVKEIRKVNSPYGHRKDPFTGTRSFHNGIDLPAHYEPVYAMFAGMVEAVGDDKRSGRYIILSHGEYRVSYCHLSEISVKEGNVLRAGEVIGVSGNSGRSTGPHLHLTVRRLGKYVNPMVLLDFIRVTRQEAVSALGGSGDEQAFLLPADFLSYYSVLAMEHQRKYGIPSSVTLAQMALESEYGCSRLARHGKNYFGIKCSRQWLSEGRPYSLHDDERPNEKFCNYSSVEESIDHHSRLLMSNRYKKCRRYGQTDYVNWLNALIDCGYASRRDYVRSCLSIIKKYRLYEYDNIAAAI